MSMYGAKTVAHSLAFPQFVLQLLGLRRKLWDTRLAEHFLIAMMLAMKYEPRIETLTTFFFLTVLARVRLDVVGDVACLSTALTHQSCPLFPSHCGRHATVLHE